MKFTSDNQPTARAKRGKSDRTKIIEALKRAGKSEEGFYDLLIGRALDPDDSFAVKEVLLRMAPLKKATMPEVEFDFNSNSTPSEQVAQLISAASDGLIAPDVASVFIQSVKNASDIEANTELKARIEKLEELLSA